MTSIRSIPSLMAVSSMNIENCSADANSLVIRNSSVAWTSCTSACMIFLVKLFDTQMVFMNNCGQQGVIIRDRRIPDHDTTTTFIGHVGATTDFVFFVEQVVPVRQRPCFYPLLFRHRLPCAKRP